MHIDQQVRFWERTQPEKSAIIFNDTTLTCAELKEEVSAVARGLVDAGGQQGDRVRILMLNRIETAVSLLATLRIGAICAPLNFRLIGKELVSMVEDCSPVVILAEGELAPLLDESAKVVDFKLFATETGGEQDYAALRKFDGETPNVAIDEDDIAFICYTSGTTGVQKGAALSHRNILSVGEAAALEHNLTGEDRVLASAPLVYTGSGISVFMQLCVYPGSTMILLADFNAEIGLDAILRLGATATNSVPVIWERMSQLPDFDKVTSSGLHYAGAGGAPVSVNLLERYRAHGIPLTQVYGCTEASGLVATMDYENALKRPGFAGLPLIGTEIKIERADGTIADPGEVGEIIVKGPHVMTGYWNRPEMTAETIVDGWLRTGDLGFQDEEGFLKVVDRSKDMLVSGGLNVYPAEIERALAQISGVEELAVIGVANEQWGESPLVVLRTSEGADPNEVLSRLEEASIANLGRFKRPSHAVIIDREIPRTFSGKIAKPVLRNKFSEVPEDAVVMRQS